MAFSVICFQEIWLKDDDDGISPYLLPGHNLMNQAAVCSKHGGLMTYVKQYFPYNIKHLNKNRICGKACSSR